MKRKPQFWLGRIIVVLLLTPLAVWAESGQFYFLARTAPVGSLSEAGQNQEGVYLRWDALEGELPADVEQLRLLRDGETLLEVGANEVMSEDQIAALYQGGAQQRRLLETVTQLQEAQAGAGQSFSANGFASLVHDRLTSDTGADTNWAFLASRSDFNIARARHRGYFDQPGRGTFTYELLAVDAGGETARLGRAQVDTTSLRQVQAPDRFEQVTQARCDAPEYAKDHYTVTLDWSAPGAGLVTDRLASHLFVSGYDLYRTTDNLDISVDEAPTRNIAALAASADHDSRGQVQIDGLEKVNDVLLTLSPDGNDQTPEWLETHEDLRNAGLKPGDHRAYYLVPRDFTGHYGPTIGTMVTVPNLTRPAKPWDVRVFADNSPDDPDKNIALSFDRVTLRNYLDVYEDNYRICNRAGAAQTGVLYYVGKNESCQEDTQRSLRLDVTDYKIYRFESFEAASQFSDSDGDGVADADERDLGMQCDPGAQPARAESALVETTDSNPSVETLPNSGRERIRFQDTVPASETNRETGRVFWYRLAAQTADKRLSLLTSPQRALFPERELPDSPTVALERTAEELISCSLETTDTTGPWDFIDDLKRHGTLEFSCDGQSYSGLTANQLQPEGDACMAKEVLTACSDSTTSSMSYSEPLAASGPSCSVDLPADVDICSQGQVRLAPEYGPVRKPLDDVGAVIRGPLHITVNAPDADSCVSLYRTVDGEQSRVATSCGSDVIGQIDYTADRGLFCGYAVTHDGNNNVSVPADVPCTLIRPDEGQKAPSTPQVVSVGLTGDSAELAWRLPVEPVAATLIELRHTNADGDQKVDLVSVPVADIGAGEVQEHIETIASLVGEEDEWCVRLRSVSPSSVESESLSSDWSSPRCVTRSDEPRSAPEYLPWPSQPGLPQGPDVQAQLGTELPERNVYSEGYGNVLLSIASVEGLLQDCFFIRYLPGGTFEYRVFPEVECNRSGKARAQAAVRSELDFVVYRQGRAPDGTLGEWIQVSPLIDYTHWDDVPLNEKQGTNTKFNDPYIKAYEDFNQQDLWHFVFVDRYPYITGHDYRYQLVYFSDDHRLNRWRQSDWVTADPGVYSSAELAQETE